MWPVLHKAVEQAEQGVLDLSPVAVLLFLILIFFMLRWYMRRRAAPDSGGQSQHQARSSTADAAQMRIKPIRVEVPRRGPVEAPVSASVRMQHPASAGRTPRHEPPPDTQRATRAGEFDIRVDESPLALMGYRVGKTNGKPEPERRAILASLFEGYVPNQFDAEYFVGWGGPNTKRRFERMTGHLKMLIKQADGRAAMAQARAEWESDLAWFVDEFGDRFR